MNPTMQAKVDEAAREYAAVRDHSSFGAERGCMHTFKAGAQFLYPLMQAEIAEAEKRGYMKAVEKLRSQQASQHFYNVVDVEEYRINVGPSIWADWLESELGGEKK